VEIKNLNSFRALERGVAYEIKRQSELIREGGAVAQETVGWDEATQATFSQRSKEEAHDYRYFPEPDLPPLVVSDEWIAEIRSALPELPWNKVKRFVSQYGLSHADASVLAAERAIGQYYEDVVEAGAGARVAANWILGELFARLNESGLGVEALSISPKDFAELLALVTQGEINNNTGKAVLAEMLTTGKRAAMIVSEQGLKQVSDNALIERLVTETLNENPNEVTSYRAGKTTIANFLFGQVMRKAGGKANPHVVRTELEKQLGSQ
jgi:aspartyl-tRNA(Asn)/glutamyl-tRNA(Gln) amidotransferase subunit B